MSERATYLYLDGSRYWYSTQPTVSRLADDRAVQLPDAEVAEEISRRLRMQAGTRGDFVKVHACVPSGDIPDEKEARLVVLGPEYPHTGKEKDSPALKEAQATLENRGTSPRTFRNTLIFLAPDSNRLQDLENAARQYLAWQSIVAEHDELGLEAQQARTAETRCKNADETVEARIPETYQWLLVPEQLDPSGSVEWSEIRQQGQDDLAVRASKKLRNEELLLVELGGTRLRHELDRIPLWRGNHVGVRQLIDDFATYVYLPRLRDKEVLIEAAQDGLSKLLWQEETFAYADSWDEAKGRYVGLVAGQDARVLDTTDSLLVKPEVAAAQLEEETKVPVGGNGGEGGGGGEGGDGPEPLVIVDEIVRRFHGSIRLDPLRMSRDVGSIADEVVQHLASELNSRIEVTLEIQAIVPDGVPEKTIRDVSENCRTLKFESYGFEKE